MKRPRFMLTSEEPSEVAFLLVEDYNFELL
jgi:hypothetical protein